MKKGEWWTVVILVVLLAGLVLGVTACDGVPDPGESPLVAGVPVAAGEPAGMTAEWILATLAAILSLALEVTPGLAVKWNVLDATVKRLIWLGGCLGVPLMILAAGCAGLDLGVLAPACCAEGVIESLQIGFAAFFGSQVTYAAVAKSIRKRKALASYNQ